MAFYYPKSQIKTNLYTNGGEYMSAATKVEYIGFYYQVSTGKKFIGKVPNSYNSSLLIPLASPETSGIPPTKTEIIYKPNYDGGETYLSPDGLIINEDYNELTKSKNIANSRFAPTPYYSQPTAETSPLGEYQRYFAKKNNELIYIEISKETYDQFINKDPKVAFELYGCISFPWNTINTTPDEDYFQTNQNIVSLIERNNKWYGFSSYFQGDFG